MKRIVASLYRRGKSIARYSAVAVTEAAYRGTRALPVDWRNEGRFHTRLRRLHAARGWLLHLLESRPRMQALRNRHRGQRCFIICNGPSLNRTNLELLKNEVTIGMNSIFLKFPEMSFRPTYYAVMDDLVIADREREINALSSEGMTRVFPLQEAYALKHARDVVWMNCPDTDGDVTVPSFSKDFERYVVHGSTITFICIQLAYHLGCDPVYVVGCDNSYRRPDSVIEEKPGHWESAEDDPNHFDPSYFGKGYRWHDPRTDLMTRSYRLARWIYDEAGRRIYNATLGGHLEEFERVDYYSLFERAGEPRPSRAPVGAP